MKCAIYGAGSLGTILGAYITKAGIDIELVNRNKAHTTAQNGIPEPGGYVRLTNTIMIRE